MPGVDLGQQDPTCTAAYHGTNSAYSHAGCRCPHARADRRRYRPAGRRVDYVDSTGTRRRLQALAVLSWPTRELAARLGVHPGQVRHWLCGTHPRVSVDTRSHVDALYRALAYTIGPSARARDYAVRCGWVSPLRWADDTIDDPAAQPLPPDAPEPGFDPHDDEHPGYDAIAVELLIAGARRLRQVKDRADRVQAYRVLAGRGLGNGSIARVLHASTSTVLELAALANPTPPAGEPERVDTAVPAVALAVVPGMVEATSRYRQPELVAA